MKDKNKTKTQLIAESQANLLSLIENRNESIWSIDKNYNFIIFNSFFANEYFKSFNIKLKPGLNALDILSPELQKFWKEKYSTVLSGSKQTFEFEFEMEGALRTYEVYLNPIIQEEEITGVSAISTEITDRKKAEEALAHSHGLMSYVIEHSRSAIAVHDKDMNYIYVSQRYLDEYKVKEREVIGKHHYEVFPDLPQKWRDVHQKALAGETSSAEDDPYEREDGTVDWTRWECRPWYEADGSIGGIIVYTEVITERKQAEAELHKSARNLKEAQKIGKLGFWDFNLETKEFTWSDEAFVIYGFEPQQFVPTFEKFVEIVHPDDLEQVQQDVNAAIEGKARYDVDFRFVLPTKEVGWLHCEGEVTRNDKGGAIRFFGIQIDITERKQTEKELILAIENAEKSEEYLNNIINNMGDPVFVKDDQSRLLVVNDAFCKIFGLQRAEIVGKTLAEDVPPDERESFLRIDKQVLRDGQENINEEALTIREAETRTISTRKTRFIDENGQKFLIGVIRDLTERKKTEEALKESEHKFRSVLENIQLIGIMLDVDANIIFVNDYFLKLTGWQSQEVIGQNWFNMFIPGKIDKDIKKVFHETLVEDNVVNSYTNDIITKSGEIRHIIWSYTAHYNSEHKPVSVTSIGEDITERMLAEEELKKHRDHLEKLVEERTVELEAKNKDLDEYNKLFIGREFRIKELRDKVKAYEEKYGKLD